MPKPNFQGQSLDELPILPQPSRTGGGGVVGEGYGRGGDWISQRSGIGGNSESVFVELNIRKIYGRVGVSDGCAGVFKVAPAMAEREPE